MQYKTSFLSTQTASFTKWLWRGVLIALGIFIIAWAIRSWFVLTFPYQVEYGEGPVLDWVLTLRAGTWPYKPIQPAPWTFSVYTPGYLLAAAIMTPLVTAAGLSPWAGGRVLSLLSAVALAGIAYALVLARLQQGERPVGRAGWIAAGLWLASPYVTRWATFYRPDMFALLWSALGILLVIRARGRTGYLLLAAGAFVVGVFAKQSFLAAPLTAVLYLFWRDRRAAPVLMGGMIAVAFALVAFLWAVVGTALFEDLIVANANPYDWTALWHFEWAFVRLAPVVLVLALLSLRRINLVGSWWILAMLATLGAGKTGAWENYFLEPFFAAVVLMGGSLARYVESERTALGRLIPPVLVLLQLVLFLPGFERFGPVAERRWLAELADEEASLAALVAATPDPLLSEHIGVLAQQGRPVWLHSFVYTQLVRQGVFDDAQLLDRITSQAYPLVIQRADARIDRLELDRWSQAMLNAIESAYAPGQRIGRWLVLRPFAPQRSADAALNETIRLWRWDASIAGEQVPAGPIELSPNRPLRVHLLWRTAARPEADYTAYVHLVDWRGNPVAQSDRVPRTGTAPTGAWEAGDIVHDLHTLSLPAELPAGAYRLIVGMYQQGTLGSLQQAGSPITLAGLKVPLNAPMPSIAEPLASIGDVMTLVNIRVIQEAIVPGQPLTIEAVWQAEEPPTRTLIAFLHLVGPCTEASCRQSPRAQDDHEPLHGRYPTAVWSAGEIVTTRHTVTVPIEADPSAGTYFLRLGWYDAATGARLSIVSDRYEVVDDAISISLPNK